eukprot:scaffold50815_cov40-Attheya_sp.AAC.2
MPYYVLVHIRNKHVGRSAVFRHNRDLQKAVVSVSWTILDFKCSINGQPWGIETSTSREVNKLVSSSISTEVCVCVCRMTDRARHIEFTPKASKKKNCPSSAVCAVVACWLIVVAAVCAVVAGCLWNETLKVGRRWNKGGRMEMKLIKFTGIQS